MDLLVGILGPLLLLLLVTSIMLRDMRRVQGSFFRPVMLGFAPIFALSVFNFVALETMPAEDMAKLEDQYFSQAKDLISQSESPVVKSVTDDAVKEVVDFLIRLMPGIVCIFWLGLLTLLALLMRRWFGKRGLPLGASPLSRWQAPDFLIWLLLVPAALLIFESRSWLGDVKPWLVHLSWNLVAVLLAIYFFQGLLVLYERIHRLGPSKTLTLMIVLCGLCLALLPQGKGIVLGFMALGILDVWFNFRNLKPKHDDHERSSS